MNAGKQDGYLIAASGSSVTSIALCSGSSDEFISDAAQLIYDEYDHTFSGATDGAVLRGHSIVATEVSPLTSGLLVVAALSR